MKAITFASHSGEVGRGLNEPAAREWGEAAGRAERKPPV